MALIYNPQSGQLAQAEDPAPFIEQGWKVPTPEEADAAAKQIDFGSTGQQALAQGERVVRGLTLGQVPGLANYDAQDTADTQSRADVSREAHPVISAIADIAPAVAVGAVTGGIGDAVAGGEAAAGGYAALAGESVGAGAVQGAQQAFEEGRRYLSEDPGRDAENTLLWSGLNFGLGAATKILAGGGAGAARAAEGVSELDKPETLQDIMRGAEEAHVSGDGAPASPAPASAPVPLTDIHLPDAEGQLEPVSPDDPRAAQVAPEIQQAADQALVGKSLAQLRALPLAADDRAVIDSLKQDETFLGSGNVSDNFGRNRGGLPAISIYPGEDGSPEISLGNGRHRLTAAREAGMDSIVANVTNYDAEGNTLWDYVGPVRINAPAVEGSSKTVAAAGRVAERAAVDDSFERALAESSRSEADDIVRQAIGKDAPAPEETSFGRQRALYQNRDAIMNVATKELQSDFTEVVGKVEGFTSRGKLADVARNVGENDAAQRVQADGIAKTAAELAGALRGEARRYAAENGGKGLQYPVAGEKGLVLALMDHAQALGEADTGSSLFRAANAFKQTLDEYKISLEKGSENSLNPIHHQQLIPRIADLAGQVRSALEDPSVWGKAGEMQGAYNAVIHDQLIPASKVFNESVLKKTGQDYSAGWKLEGWESRIRSLLDGGDIGAQRHVSDMLGAMDALGGLRAKYGDQAGGDALQAQVAKIRRTLKLGDQVRDASVRMQAAGALGRHVPLIGRGIQEMITGDLANNFRRLMGATDSAIEKGVDDWIRSSATRSSNGIFASGARALASAVKGVSADPYAAIAARQGISIGLAKFMGDDKTPLAAFTRARAALLDDQRFFQELGGDYRALQDNAPEVYMMLGARAADARQFLTERMPANVSVSMMRPEGYPPNRHAIEDWAVYWNAVRRPVDVVRNLGSARIQEMQTLQRFFPRLYEQTQQRAIEKFAAARASGQRIDDSTMLRMDLLFGGGIAPTASPAFSREAVQLAQSYADQQTQQQGAQGGGRSSSRAGRPITPPSPMAGLAQAGATMGQGF